MTTIISSDNAKHAPNAPPHPGVLLQQHLDKRDIKPSVFALTIGAYPSAIVELIKGKRNISAAMALKLEQALGNPAEYWMRAQADYEVHVERRKG